METQSATKQCCNSRCYLLRFGSKAVMISPFHGQICVPSSQLVVANDKLEIVPKLVIDDT